MKKLFTIMFQMTMKMRKNTCRMFQKSAHIFIIMLLATSMVSGYSIENIRDGIIYIRGGNNQSVNVNYEPAYSTETHKDFVYFQSPAGDLIDCREINFGQSSGNFSFNLNAGFGDYIITIAAYSYRKFTLDIDDNLSAVYSPSKFYINAHLSGSMNQFYFYVPSGTVNFTINGRRDNNSTVEILRLFDPSNTLTTELNLPEPEYNAYAPFSSYTASAPDTGFWRIEFPILGNTTKVAFWLDDLPNCFCLNPAQWFVPEHENGTTKISGGRICGKTGMIGGELGGNPASQVLDNIAFIGLEANNYYIGHNYREPVNDNADPSNINWTGFNWNDDERIDIFTGDPFNLELTQLFMPADWIGGMITTQDQRDELAEFFEAYLIHHNVENDIGMKYFIPIDEPNLKGYSLNDYTELVQTLAQRKNDSPYIQVSSAEIQIPGSSNFIEFASNNPEQIGCVWAEYLYKLYDNEIDGINFHQWDWRTLLNLHRYKTDVETAHHIISTYDTDNDTLETIVIDQTNISSGSGSSPYYVNTFYASLWWASVICNTIGTGYVDIINWFTTVDDNYHKKGLMYGPDNHYNIKPAGYATKFLIENILDYAVSINTDHPEIYAMCSVDSLFSNCRIIAVNTADRKNSVSFNLMLPDEMMGGYDLQILKLQEGMTEAVIDSTGIFNGSIFDIKYHFEPQTLYAFNLYSNGSGIPDDPANSKISHSCLSQNYPNPFNSITTVDYQLHYESHVIISIYNILGQKVLTLLDKNQQAGYYNIEWDAASFESGLYFYLLKVENRKNKCFEKINKMLLLK